MSIFDDILEKIGLKKPEEEKKTFPQSGGTSTSKEMVDVEKKIAKMAEGTNLDWRVSIVDLLKVLGIDSSLEARKELAVELGCPPEIMQDNVKMNVWLHKTVMEEIAENGGNVPKELLD